MSDFAKVGAFGALPASTETGETREAQEQNAPDMNKAPLEEFAVNMGITLAGMFASEPSLMPLDMDQLGMVIYCGVCAVARSQPDYNPKTNVSDVVALGVGAYAEGLYAAVAENVKEDGNQEDDPSDSDATGN